MGRGKGFPSVLEWWLFTSTYNLFALPSCIRFFPGTKLVFVLDFNSHFIWESNSYLALRTFDHWKTEMSLVKMFEAWGCSQLHSQAATMYFTYKSFFKAYIYKMYEIKYPHLYTCTLLIPAQFLIFPPIPHVENIFFSSQWPLFAITVDVTTVLKSWTKPFTPDSSFPIQCCYQVTCLVVSSYSFLFQTWVILYPQLYWNSTLPLYFFFFFKG